MRQVTGGWIGVFLALVVGVSEAEGQGGVLVVANMADNTASVIDLESGVTRATLPTGEGPHEVAVSRDGETAVVTNYGVRGAPGNTLTVIDLENAVVARTIDLGEYLRPHGIAFLASNNTVAVTSESSEAVLIVNIETGAVMRTIPTGQQASHMLSVSANGQTMITTNVVEGSITHLSPSGPGRIIRVAPMVEGLGVSPGGDEVWVGSNQDRTVSVVDVATGQVGETLDGFGFPYRIAWTPGGETVLISDPARSEVRVVNAATLSTTLITFAGDDATDTAEFPGSASPEGIAITRDGQRAYVTLQGMNRVAEIDLATNEITRTFPTGSGPDGVGVGM